MKQVIYFLAITTALIALTFSMPRLMLVMMPAKSLAENGNVKFQLKLAYDYMQGTNGVTQDRQEAMKWFRKAAEQGDVNAQGIVGIAYYQGMDGYPKDRNEAMKWLHKSADGGSKIAQNLIGTIEKNRDESITSLKNAAEQGDVSAQLKLARFFGKSEDWEQSTNWFGKAAINGNAQAQRAMGGAYVFGRGVPKNPIVSYMWFSLADDQTLDESQKVATIPTDMTKEQAEELKRIAKERIQYLRTSGDKIEANLAHNLLLGSKLSKGMAPSAKVEIKPSSAAQADAQLQNDPYSRIPEQILIQIQPKGSIEQFVFQTIQPIRQNGVDQQFLTKEGITKLQETQLSMRRASQVQSIIIADINGDGKVTGDEAKEYYTNQMHNYGLQNDSVEKAAQIITKFDINHDGLVDFEEMRILDTSNEELMYYSDNGQLMRLLDLDPNKDGKLTVAELESVARKLFSAIDKNNDGIISEEEYQPVEIQISSARNRQNLLMESIIMQSKCDLPKASEKSKILLYSVYEGAAVSPVAVAGQDLQTNVAKVTIEQGNEPIYLVLSTYSSVLWQIEGSTDRVERVVLISQERSGDSALPVSAIMGIDKSKVVFKPSGACFRYFSDKKESDIIEQAVANIKAMVDQNVDSVFLQYTANDLLLPSGEIVNAVTTPKMPAGFDKSVWDRAVMLTPYGIAADVKTQDVVAAGKVENYEILPNLFGVSQLVGQGTLEKLQDGNYKIVKPISHYPAGLYGGYSVNFVLGKGIPRPKGDAGHSCVISEETGKPIGQAITCGH